jgi:hypothetical protein
VGLNIRLRCGIAPSFHRRGVPTSNDKPWLPMAVLRARKRIAVGRADQDSSVTALDRGQCWSQTGARRPQVNLQ